jgi:hypothetical protein
MMLESNAVLFYFFDKRPGTPNSPADALRAMLAQLILLHRRNKQVVDIASVIFSKNMKSKDGRATEAEVVAVFELLLNQLQLTYLVFDGLDECSDPDALFNRLRDIASRSKMSAVIFLGRPSTQLPADLRKGCLLIEPTPLDNNDDIKKYVGTQLPRIIQGKQDMDESDSEGNDSDDMLSDSQDSDGEYSTQGYDDENKQGDIDTSNWDVDLEPAIFEIVQRANGMFLWVKLLLDYLNLPSLTIQDITDAITNLNRLEGLDSIYTAILTNLQNYFKGNSLTSVCRLFQMVAYSEHQLELAELHCAISMPLERARTTKDKIPKFKTSIGPLSGALLELSKEKKVQFIHLSAQEYYVKASTAKEHYSNSKILTSEALASRNVAAFCLSYLVHTVPSKPLGGSSQVTPSLVFVRQKYPFLQYCAKHWSSHLSKAFATSPGRKESQEAGDASWVQLSGLVHTLLSKRENIMMWIEASWLEQTPPRIQLLPDIDVIGSILKDKERKSFKVIETATVDLKELNRDLESLSRSWSYVLKREPNEIWEPSIPCFNSSRFWLNTKEAHVTRAPLLQSDSESVIIIRSKVSENGMEIGIVKLITPK